MAESLTTGDLLVWFPLNYRKFKEDLPGDRYYSHDHITGIIDRYRKSPLFEITTAGHSVEEREIALIRAGTGNLRVFMWARMHGDEPTASSALMDLLKFLRKPVEFKEIRDTILEGVTLYIMPLVNPDGAERFTRENVNGVDLNRDAIDLSSPESRVLMEAFRKIKPHFAFNLHDQGRAHAVGKTGRSATISFLAPPPDEAKTITENRENAMKLITEIAGLLQVMIPGHIGRYSDGYEPRAFGDTFQSMGAATILIESGGWEFDLPRQFQRELNFILFIRGLYSIATGGYKKHGVEGYFALPENRKLLYDHLITEAFIDGEGRSIGINLKEKMRYPVRGVWFEGLIQAVGALKGRSGYHEFLAKGYVIKPGKTLEPGDIMYPGGNELLAEADLIRHIDLSNFYRYVEEGYTNIRVSGEGSNKRFTLLPLNIVSEKGNRGLNHDLSPGRPANIIISKGKKTGYAFINGFFINVRSRQFFPLNTLHLKP